MTPLLQAALRAYALAVAVERFQAQPIERCLEAVFRAHERKMKQSRRKR